MMSLFGKKKEIEKKTVEITEIYFKDNLKRSFTAPSDGLKFSEQSLELQKWWERKNEIYFYPYNRGILMLKRNEIVFIEEK
jgi:hypothetical protein